jgi:hypothetical protein
VHTVRVIAALCKVHTVRVTAALCKVIVLMACVSASSCNRNMSKYCINNLFVFYMLYCMRTGLTKSHGAAQVVYMAEEKR